MTTMMNGMGGLEFHCRDESICGCGAAEVSRRMDDAIQRVDCIWVEWGRKSGDDEQSEATKHCLFGQLDKICCAVPPLDNGGKNGIEYWKAASSVCPNV